jgi:endonuclease I
MNTAYVCWPCWTKRAKGREITVTAPAAPRHGQVIDLLQASLLYMHVEYELDLKGMLPMLKRWNANDPPNAHERWRNNQIEKLEDIRNRFIDDRSLADQLQ